MKKLFLFLLIIINSINPKFNLNLVDKNKSSLTLDAANSMLGRYKGFELNFSNFPIELAKNNRLIFGALYMGHYRSEAYNFNKRLAYINFTPNMLKHTLPNTLKKYLKNYFKLNSNNWLDTLKANLNEIHFSTTIFGTLLDKKNEPIDDTYNVIYHSWVGSWPEHRYKEHMNFFREDINVGIFNPIGVKKVTKKFLNKTPKDGDYIDGATFDKTKKEPITWHSPQHISPNNLRIQLSKKKNLNSFWSIATSQDKKRLSINYILIANNLKAEEWLLDILSKSKNILDIYNNIEKELPEADWLTKTDKKILLNWLKVVTNSAKKD